MTSSAILDIKNRFKPYLENEDHRGLVSAMRDGGYLNDEHSILKRTQIEDAFEESLKRTRRPRVLRGTIPWMETFELRANENIGIIEENDTKYIHLFKKANVAGITPFSKTYTLPNVSH